MTRKQDSEYKNGVCAHAKIIPSEESVGIKTFKGLPLDPLGRVEGAYPECRIEQITKNAFESVARNANQIIMDYCVKLNIDPDVLLKQKAEIERLTLINNSLEGYLREVIQEYKRIKPTTHAVSDIVLEADRYLEKFC